MMLSTAAIPAIVANSPGRLASVGPVHVRTHKLWTGSLPLRIDNFSYHDGMITGKCDAFDPAFQSRQSVLN